MNVKKFLLSTGVKMSKPANEFFLNCSLIQASNRIPFGYKRMENTSLREVYTITLQEHFYKHFHRLEIHLQLLILKENYLDYKFRDNSPIQIRINICNFITW